MIASTSHTFADWMSAGGSKRRGSGGGSRRPSPLSPLARRVVRGRRDARRHPGRRAERGQRFERQGLTLLSRTHRRRPGRRSTPRARPIGDLRPRSVALRARPPFAGELRRGPRPDRGPCGAKLFAELRPFELIVASVPGRGFPLYMGGARLSAAYPSVPLFEDQALAIAVFSYAGTLFWASSPSRA